MILLRLFIVIPLCILTWLFFSQFFFCTRFDFVKSEPFAGPVIYNPYDSSENGRWLKCNFHAHTKAWEGMTNGKGTADDVHRAYDSLHYDIHCISNYQHIETRFLNDSFTIPAYEHGYNVMKTHQLVLGSYQVNWLDYLFPQMKDNKQDILNHLSADPEAVVVLNHPDVRHSYSSEDLASLTNYHCMEVLNPAKISVHLWDAALSAGKPAFITGNDDLHNVVSKNRLGKMCTMLNTREESKSGVLRALREGRSAGVIVGATQDAARIPYPVSFKVRHDTVFLKMDQPAKQIIFSGQNGKHLASFRNTDAGWVKLKKNDRYARATIAYDNGTTVYLNPAFFTRSKEIVQTPVIVNLWKTLLFRSVGILIAALYVRWCFIFITGGKGLFRRRRWLYPVPGGLRSGNAGV